MQSDKAHLVVGRVCHGKLLFPDASANVTKNRFLKLRYPKGMTGSLPLCPSYLVKLKDMEFWLSIISRGAHCIIGINGLTPKKKALELFLIITRLNRHLKHGH